MSEWKTIKLNKGKTYGGLSGKSAKDFVSGDSPYVTFMEVLSNVKLTKPPTAKVKIKSGESQNIVKKNDLLLNGSSETPEEVAIPTSVNFSSDIPIYLNSFCFGYRPDTDDIDSDFLSYFLRSSEGRELIVQLAAGSTRYNISKRSFTNLELLLPPLPEQQRIARVLGDIDDEIATLEELVAKKRLVKTAVMQQLLTGKVRLTADGRAVTGADIERESGHLHDWRRVKLGEIIVPVVEKIKSSNLSFGGYITTENMGHGTVNFDVVPPLGINVQRFRAGDVLISNIRPYLKKYWTADFDGGASNDVLVFRADSRVLRGELLPRYLGQDSFFEYCTLHSNGTKMPRGDKQKIAEYEFDMPTDKSEQTRIADILTDIDEDIAIHETLISKKRQVKTGVMQQLLTGKTRLLEAA